VSPELILTSTRMVARQDEGRSLFTTALDADMASQTAGVSCSTCHLDGRSDGVVWNLPHGRRVTKALGGTVSETGPFTWTELSATVEAQARETVFERMGGRGISPDQSVSVAAWFDAMRLPVALRPARDSPDWDSVLRGEELFRGDLGCADCHIPEHHYTDGWGYPVLGDEQVNTPSLRGVSAHGPYFHNGRAAPLKEAVLAREMSDAWTLTEDELADLLAFLAIL
jgi:cytochrome c peroxidase